MGTLANRQDSAGSIPYGGASLQIPASKAFKVILAEDEKPILGMYSGILSRSGFLVIKSFENGRDLADFVELNADPELNPDVVITDFRMPIMDGVEASKRIRAAKPAIKIILASAYDLSMDDMGLFDVVLKKPFGKKELLGAVSQCLDLGFDG